MLWKLLKVHRQMQVKARIEVVLEPFLLDQWVPFYTWMWIAFNSPYSKI